VSVYSCHSDHAGLEPRGKTTESLMQSGWTYQQRGDHMTREPVMRKVVTAWIPMACGKLAQEGYTDKECAGCVHDQG